MNEFEKKVLDSIDINPDKLSHEQIDIILYPINAPENYYQDGEISPLRAKQLHNDNLCRANINGRDRVNALRLCS